MSAFEKAANEVTRRAAEAVARAVAASAKDSRLDLVSARAQYAMSNAALRRSACRGFFAAVDEHGDAAAAGDLNAVEQIHEAGTIAGMLSAGMLGSIR